MFLNVSYLKVILSCTELTVKLSMVRSYRGLDHTEVVHVLECELS